MEKVSSAIRKSVKSLETAKGRRAEHAFVTERTKNVIELLNSPFHLRWLIATTAWFENHRDITVCDSKCLVASTADMERMSSLSTPSDVMAVFDLPSVEPRITLDKTKLYLALDGIQDPGNMGTIVRLADWFGVDTIFAGRGTVDPFNPKSIISSMGSIARVKVVECDLNDVLQNARKLGLKVFGTFMSGQNIFELTLQSTQAGVIVMGNEGNGISDEIANLITDRITIPSFPPGNRGAESLNVAMATAITLAEFRRRNSD